MTHRINAFKETVVRGIHNANDGVAEKIAALNTTRMSNETRNTIFIIASIMAYLSVVSSVILSEFRHQVGFLHVMCIATFPLAICGGLFVCWVPVVSAPTPSHQSRRKQTPSTPIPVIHQTIDEAAASSKTKATEMKETKNHTDETATTKDHSTPVSTPPDTTEAPVPRSSGASNAVTCIRCGHLLLVVGFALWFVALLLNGIINHNYASIIRDIAMCVILVGYGSLPSMGAMIKSDREYTIVQAESVDLHDIKDWLPAPSHTTDTPIVKSVIRVFLVCSAIGFVISIAVIPGQVFNIGCYTIHIIMAMALFIVIPRAQHPFQIIVFAMAVVTNYTAIIFGLFPGSATGIFDVIAWTFELQTIALLSLPAFAIFSIIGNMTDH